MSIQKLFLGGTAFLIGGAIGLSLALYSEAARAPEPKEPEPFPIFLEEQEEPEEEKAVFLTAGEKTMLQKVAIAEAGHEDTDSMAMVMRVVINRRDNEEGMFPDSIEQVLYQQVEGAWQFECMKEGGSYWNVKPNEASAEALALIENGLDESEGALFFHSDQVKNCWISRHREFLFNVGGNCFYR